MNDLKIVFMGTPDFAAASLEALTNNGLNVVGCFTNPDRPSGRGMKLKFSEVKEVAIKNNIPVFQPEKLRNNPEVMEILNKLSPDLIVVVAYGKILPKEILKFPRLGCINVHGSLLPKYRGAAPIQWSIINGETVTGITTMYMDEGMDTGDMLLKEEVEIKVDDNFESLYNKLKDVGASLLIKTISGIVNGEIIPERQSDEFSLAPMINKDMTKLNFNKNAKDIFNLVRGLCPAPATYMSIDNDTKFKVYKVSYEEKDMGDIPNGKVIEISKKVLSIKCNNGIINILEIQPPNSKRMDIRSFLAGNNIIDIDTKFI